MQPTLNQKLKALGPGLLYAGAAIGVSHIVQSTQAGARYGWILVIGIVLAHIFKYPFFEIGPRYTAVKGENLLYGYARLGKWALIIVMVLTVSTMFTIQAAVTVVTAGLAIKITGIEIPAWEMSAILLAICIAILAVGKFNVLDNLMKVIMIVLAITTLVAFVASFNTGVEKSPEFMAHFQLSNPADVVFLIAFLGWMPAPLDIAIWHSLWSEEKNEVTGSKSSLSQTLFDFKVGYWGTAILAFCFLALGANVIYGSGTELSSSAGVYAGQLIDIYSVSIGSWSFTIIAIAAFTTMFSTTLTCLDAAPRVLASCKQVWKFNPAQPAGTAPVDDRKLRIFIMFIISIGASVMLAFFISSMKQMVTIATSISFLTAPVLAFLGILIVRRYVQKDFWTLGKTIVAWTGFVLLLLLSIYYLISLNSH